ncbi:hypothetical protein FQZ97_537160 [compost metagenome]
MKWIVVAAALALAGCGETKPTSLVEISKSITEVSTAKVGSAEALVFALKPDFGYDNQTYFFMATQEANRILPKLLKYFPEQKSSHVVFTLNAKLVDQYGNEKQAPVIQLAFSMDDIRKVNYQSGTFTSWNLLGLTSNVEYLHPAGRTIVRDYCADESNAENAARFCRSAI